MVANVELKPLESRWQLGLWKNLGILLNIISFGDLGFLEPGQREKGVGYPPDDKYKA